jgi:DNA-binding NarL/FixJ family response regulator
MRVLFLDDDPELVEGCARALREAGAAEVSCVRTVAEAVGALHDTRVDVLVMDLFIPLGDTPAATLGPRARRYAEHVEHLGGIVLLDELERVPTPPVTLLHTACRDRVVLELARERVHTRVRKPASADVLLAAVLEVLRELEGG